MCSPRNGEAAGGDAAPPPRPPLSRSAILPHSPGHPGGARRGGGGGCGGEGGTGAARGRRRGDRLGTARRAHLRRAGRGSRPRAALGTGASASERAPGSSAGLGYAPPRPAPYPGAPPPRCALQGAEVAAPRSPEFGPAPPSIPRSNNSSFPFRKALCVPAGSLPGVGLAPGYGVTNGGILVPGTRVDPLAADKGSQERRVVEEGRKTLVGVGSWLLGPTDFWSEVV